MWECPAPPRRAPAAMPSFASSACFRSSAPSVRHASLSCSYAWMTRGCSAAKVRYADGSFFSMSSPPLCRRLDDDGARDVLVADLPHVELADVLGEPHIAMVVP